MLKELQLLVNLQKIDLKLLEIDSLRGDLPQQVETLQNLLNALTNEIAADKKREQEALLEIKTFEAKITDGKTQLQKYHDQLYLVTSNKEYDALTTEIDTLKQEIDTAEYSILTLTDEVEKLKVNLKGKELTLAEKSKELTEKQTILEKTNTRTKDARTTLLGERADVVRLIPNRYIREYDRIAKAKKGVAVVPIQQIIEEKVDKKGNIEYIPMQVSCGGCHKIVPPQKILEIRSGDRMIRCEFCGRMLYWDEQSSEIRSTYEEELI